jgi:1-acyl-sn-glycerol-3-phosphate acyltransferase
MTIGARRKLDRPWTRNRFGRAAREFSICVVFDAIVRTYARTKISGREHLAQLDGPAIFVANHCSHVDTPVILRSLPKRRRRRTAVTAAADYFYASPILANLVSLAFGTVPLERHGAKRSAAIDDLAALIESGWSLVFYPTGTRSRDGRVGRLRPGAAALASRHGVPIVPVHVAGTRAAMPVGRHWMVRPEQGGRFARHTIELSFGPPLAVGPDDDLREVMERVRLFMQEHGEETTPDPDFAAPQQATADRSPQPESSDL